AVAEIGRDDVPVAGRNRQPSLVVDRDGGLALQHVCLPTPCPSAAGFMRWKTTIFPVFPHSTTLGVPLSLVNRSCGEFSPVRSMTCGELERLVQALSTSL